MSKMRVFELARELKVDTKTVLEILKKHRIEVKNNMSGVDDAGQSIVKEALAGAKPARKPVRPSAAKPAPAASKPEERLNQRRKRRPS